MKCEKLEGGFAFGERCSAFVCQWICRFAFPRMDGFFYVWKVRA